MPTATSYIYIICRIVLHDLSLLAIHRTNQYKSIADQWKLLYISGSKVAICVGDEFD